MEVSHGIASSFVNLFLTRGLVGSPWGAGTFAGLDGKRVPSKRELDIAKCQGEAFYEAVKRVQWD
jgi:NAD(P)H dehydrogenase (quinone)